MAPAKSAASSTTRKVYPRAAVRKSLLATSNCGVAKNVDALAYIDYALFVERLIKEAGIQAAASGNKELTVQDVKKAAKKTIQQFRG